MQKNGKWGFAILLSGAGLASACSSDATAQTRIAVDDGGGATTSTGGAYVGSGGGVHGGGAGGAHAGGSGGLHSNGSGGRFVEAGTEDAPPHGGASGTGGSVIDSGPDSSACGPKEGMCCCAGDQVKQPVCSDGGWTCQGEGYFPFYGDDCTRQWGPCWLPPGPEGGRGGSGSGGTSSGDGGICSTCKAGEVCVERQTEGGALILADAGRCPSGRVAVSNGGRTICELAPSYECAALPSTCSNPPGTPALAHCACARSLCGSANSCEDLSLSLMKCTLQVP